MGSELDRPVRWSSSDHGNVKNCGASAAVHDFDQGSAGGVSPKEWSVYSAATRVLVSKNSQ
jgi:hypothetical protein